MSLLLALLLGSLAAAEEPAVREKVETARVLVDLRVVGPRGEPLTGLGMENFRVWVDGKRVRVTSLDLIGFREGRAEPSHDEATVSAAGRRIVLFFQRSLVPSRILGLMRVREDAKRFIAGLSPQDRVAVFMHDWSLKFYTDFTTDRDRLFRIVDESIVVYRPPDHEPWIDPGEEGMAAHYDARAAERAATPEQGLVVIGRALRQIPGPKSLLYLGWGMGVLEGGVVSMEDGYDEARQALVESRTALFALDMTQADHHTLELPLTRAALDTGGFYTKTFPFPALALDEVQRAMATHYELAFAKPDLRPGLHRIRVKLKGVRGVVYHREVYTD